MSDSFQFTFISLAYGFKWSWSGKINAKSWEKTLKKEESSTSDVLQSILMVLKCNLTIFCKISPHYNEILLLSIKETFEQSSLAVTALTQESVKLPCEYSITAADYWTVEMIQTFGSHQNHISDSHNVTHFWRESPQFMCSSFTKSSGVLDWTV